MNCVLQVEFFRQSGEIVGVGVHLVTIPCLGGTTVPSPVMRDDSIALLAEEQHLSVPIVRSERPAVTEHYGLALSPVLVVNLCAVFCCDSRHEIFSFLHFFVLKNHLVPTMCSDQAVRTRSGRMALCHASTHEPDTALRI